MKRTAIIVFLVFVTAVWAGPDFQRHLPEPGEEGAQFVSREMIVQFRSDLSEEARATVVRDFGSIVRNLGVNLSLIALKEGMEVFDAVVEVQARDGVIYAQPNFVHRVKSVPNDSSYAQQWMAKNNAQTIASATYATNNPGTSGKDMALESAWDVSTDCSSIVVAVVDSGVNYNHEDLAANMWNGSVSCPEGSQTSIHGCDFVGTGSNNPMDYNGHGTHVAGIIAGAGNNGKGIAGVCWSAQIMAVRVLDASGSGSTADIVQGLNFAVQNGAKVVNMSLGGSVFDSAFSTAITNARTAGVAIVVAAGNDGSNLNSANTYPCEYSQDNILCVAALDQSYSLATFSNYDTTSVALNNVDVGAPGTNILSSFAGVTTTVNDTFNTSGTLNWSTTGSGWGYSACNLGQVVDVIGNPTTWCSLGQYANNANDTIYKTFNVPSGADMVSVAYGLFLDVASGDTFSVHYKSGSGEPFSSGTQLASYTNVSTGGSPVFLGHELKNCAGQSQCSVGYRLVTNASGTTYGPGILLFSLIGMDVDATTQYKVEDGTSMASPAAAGVVALVLSYNPSYTYLDALNAVLNSGNAQTALNGKSKTGKSVDANNAIRYLAPPTGISLTAQ